jgi:hypothetical protein
MTIEDPELDQLFQEPPAGMAHDSGVAGRVADPGQARRSNGVRSGGSTITLRIKPDRRCRIALVDPANERRRC